MAGRRGGGDGRVAGGDGVPEQRGDRRPIAEAFEQFRPVVRQRLAAEDDPEQLLVGLEAPPPFVRASGSRPLDPRPFAHQTLPSNTSGDAWFPETPALRSARRVP